jgi:hypothetical protein
MSRSGDFCVTVSDRLIKPIALPLAHARGVINVRRELPATDMCGESNDTSRTPSP